jgi:radical SAM protein with 4Fe4S-binding SPASM domain
LGISAVVPHLPRLISKRGLPIHLTFFVTARCNALCRHCFYWESLNQGQKDLTLDEVDKVAASLERVLWVAFSGGEPFLRKDLPEFAKILHDRLKPVTLSINTNGIKTDQIVASAEQLVGSCPHTFVGILCSLDGMQATHDRIRGVPRNFENTVATFRELTKLKARLPNLGVGISTTYCAWNESEMDEMYEFVVGELRPDNWDLSFVRGKPMEPAIGVADVRKYAEVKRRIEEAFASGRLRYYDKMPLSRFVHAKERLSTRMVLRTLETGAFQVPCYAGALSAVISEEGDVYACELLSEKIGNLREAGYDLAALWRTAQADSLRSFIRDTKCFCTHECNMSINLLFNPAVYPSILKEMAAEASGGARSGVAEVPGGIRAAPTRHSVERAEPLGAAANRSEQD